MRKPHVFISSRLTLGSARQEIKRVLEESGLSAEIYEKDSTPSSEPATYLRDIAEADFAVFVLDETYGTPRAISGLSGVHEEWKRVRERGIPYHVYLKRSPGKPAQGKQARFIESELVSAEVSYYYYRSPKDLLPQIRRSLVRMIFDIAHSAAFRQRLDASSVMADLVRRDHDTFSRWDKALMRLLEYEARMPERVTDVWGFLSDLMPFYAPDQADPFLDGKAQELFIGFLQACWGLEQYIYKQVEPPGEPGGEITFPDIAPCQITVFKPKPPLPPDFSDRTARLKSTISEQWDLLGALVRKRYTRYAQL
jgi:hypothetical protein